MDVGVIRADSRSGPFFEAAARDVLAIKRCGGCGRWLGPEAAGCTGCGDTGLRWEAASGLGTLVSWAVLPGGDPVLPSGEAVLPSGEAVLPGGEAVLALVELDEGPWLRSRLAGEPAAGQRVTVRFEHPDAGESYPVFVPVV
jgi:uncharacterized protein